MDKDIRNAIERATQRARKLLEEDFASQLEGTFDVLRAGTVAPKAGPHLKPRQVFQRDKIVAAIEHKRGAGMSAAEAVVDYIRDAAFTTINRFVALKMLEARELVQECLTKGEQSAGYREFCGLAPGVALLPDSAGYRLYIESLFDELSTEVKVLFDRRDPASVLWPKRGAFQALLEVLNGAELAGVWGEDETIGWVYQYFNGGEERRAMREASQAPRNSRELAVRNQFFTPRYVVQFLTDNTLGRIWYEMRGGKTALVDRCEYMVRRPDETYAPRPMKDPRDLRVLDPACGSGHFLLYAFDLLVVIYEEAWQESGVGSQVSGRSLRDDYPTLDALRRALPALVLAHNLHGVDIDPRCAQIAQLALWMRAQRAFRDLGVGRAERPVIRRSNIVVAEPLVTDDATLKEFLVKLGDPDLGRVFMELVETLKLAGDLGLLLRVEELIARGPKLGTTGYLFTPPEERIRTAIATFVAASSALAITRRRLFADDAAQGVGLLETAERKFDVVVMNPPFGSATRASQSFVEVHYAAEAGDLAAAFVTSMLARLDENGLVGVLATRKPLFIKSFGEWRVAALLQGRAISVLADLGRGILDATVEAAAYVISLGAEARTRCFRCFQGGMVRADTAEALRTTIAGSRQLDFYDFDPSVLSRLPNSPFAYWVSPDLLSLYDSLPAFSKSRFMVQTGASTKDDFRFLRLWTEVSSSRVARTREATFSGRRWVAIAKGGEYAPYFRGVELVMNWEQDGAEAKAFVTAYRTEHGWSPGWAAALNGAEQYFRPGITWSRRTSTWISPRALPAGCMFSEKAPTIFAPDNDERALEHVLGWLASSAMGALIALSVGKDGVIGTAQSNSYEVGIIAGLPFSPKSLDTKVLELVRAAHQMRQETASTDELNLLFRAPRLRASLDRSARAAALQREIDREVAAAMGVATETVTSLEITSRLLTLEGAEVFETRLAAQEPVPLDIVSFLVGVAFGRYSMNEVCGDESIPPFAPLPICSPAMRQTNTAKECSAILVDDEGHADDLPLQVHLAGSQNDELASLIEMSIDRLRWALRDVFFSHHISRFSRSRRKAPIYWQLATPTASFSVWLYIHAFTKDTLYKVQNDYVTPKLTHEERKLESLRNELGENPRAAERKILATQETFVDELRAFLDEVKRIAPLWNPDLDDGVIINFAPLWRLVPQHKPWQKELKSTWDSLCDGEYDWAHLAMHLWPERVVPKCATDRSLAIAHDLEEIFWAEGADGKWKARATPTRPVEDLVRERTSPAVKAALKSLLEAPTPGGSGKLTRKGKNDA